MTITLALSMVGIAFLDSLNPSLFVAQLYLLTTPRPVPRILSYIAGILAVNFIGGVLILSGARAVIGEVVANIDPNVGRVLQFAVGAAILAFGVWMKTEKSADSNNVKAPRSLLPIHTFILGAAVMINEITTALPYFVAIEQIIAAKLDAPSAITALVLYNAIFAVPLFGFLAAFLAYRSRFTAQIEKINAVIAKWTPRIIKWASIAFGVFLMLNAVFGW
jgi:cytochrome c biogenesis protein CcdA